MQITTGQLKYARFPGIRHRHSSLDSAGREELTAAHGIVVNTNYLNLSHQPWR